MYERTITITTAGNRKSTNWNTENLTWPEFCARLKSPIRGKETQEEYNKMPKSKQDDLKDVGGFVGGALEGTRRLKQNMTGRDLTTLDLDNIPAGETGTVLEKVESLSCAAVVYSTRKHHDRKPRLRVIVPLDRTATPEEYEPCARMLCKHIGMDYADPTTFEVARLMYWPSASSDGAYVYKTFNKNTPASVEALLGQYDNWKDINTWPQVPGMEENLRIAGAKAEDPLTKGGIIGAFCRVYSITSAMDRLLPGMYDTTDKPDRRTYANGSTYGGAVIYDDKFLFSHHATDPVGGTLVNAWDLVRIQKFGDLDAEAKIDTPVGRLPSYKEMSRFAGEDKYVQKQLQEDITEEVRESFKDPVTPVDAPEDVSWLSKLKTERNGKEYQKTISNFTLILENDENLKGKIAAEIFTNRATIKEPLPWDPKGLSYPRVYNDTDTSQIYKYIEDHYLGLYSQQKGEAAINIIGLNNRYNVVEDYLRSLKWDGTPRMETLLIDYLGADNTPYVRAATRKLLVAAAMRAISKTPVKFDPMVILTGKQGIGKSTLLRYLAKEETWFNESLTVFEGKTAAELIQGSWIVEIGELAAMSKQEVNTIKAFQTKTTDRFRRAYGRNVEDHARRCVFVGTTNDDEYLRDSTGNRRYWPIDCGVNVPTKSVFNDLQGEVDQIWAETMATVALGTERILDMDTPDLQEAVMKIQQSHRYASPMEGEIQAYLDQPIPIGWRKMTLASKRAWLAQDTKNPPGEAIRDRTCIAEVWVECYNGKPGALQPQKRKEIKDALANLPGWKKVSYPMRFSDVGVQKGYIRVEQEEEE